MSTIAENLADPELLATEWDLEPLAGGERLAGVERMLEEAVAAATALNVGDGLVVGGLPPPVHAIAITTATKSAASTPMERPRGRAAASARGCSGAGTRGVSVRASTLTRKTERGWKARVP